MLRPMTTTHLTTEQLRYVIADATEARRCACAIHGPDSAQAARYSAQIRACLDEITARGLVP